MRSQLVREEGSYCSGRRHMAWIWGLAPRLVFRKRVGPKAQKRHDGGPLLKCRQTPWTARQVEGRRAAAVPRVDVDAPGCGETLNGGVGKAASGGVDDSAAVLRR